MTAESNDAIGTTGAPENSLLEKLGFQVGDSVFVEDTPAWYSDFADANQLELEPGLPATHAHVFCAAQADLQEFLAESDLRDAGKSVWLSWPKRGSNVRTDLTEQYVRDSLLPLGWTGQAVTDIDETWCGLRFMRSKQ